MSGKRSQEPRALLMKNLTMVSHHIMGHHINVTTQKLLHGKTVRYSSLQKFNYVQLIYFIYVLLFDNTRDTLYA